jgi:hypothetical protein
MRRNLIYCIVLVLSLMITLFATAQTGQQRRTVVVNGESGEIIVYQIDGRSFVDLESLARIANGSLSFQGNQIVLTIPSAPQNSPTAAAANSQPTNSGLTDAFAKSALQTLAVTRDWTNTLAYAAQHGVPGDGSRLFTFRDRASEALHLTQVAASTQSDQNALQLLTNQVNAVQTWNNALVAQRKSMNTGQYSMTPNAMQNDPSYQKITACSTFLSTMLPSGQFQDDGSCH